MPFFSLFVIFSTPRSLLHIHSPQELEGADAWIKYEETADYKYHIVWENAKNRGWRGKCKFLAYKFADGADVVGGAVARFLGITDSRYQHVLDAAERMEEEAARDKQKEDERAIYLENLEAERLAQLEGGVAATGEVKDDVAIASGNKSSPSPADDESSRAAAFNGGVAVASVELSAGPVYRPAPSPSADPRADTSL